MTLKGFLYPEEKARIVNTRAHKGVSFTRGKDERVRTRNEPTIQQTGNSLRRTVEKERKKQYFNQPRKSSIKLQE